MANNDLVTLLSEYNYYANNQFDIQIRIQSVCSEFSIPKNDLNLFFIGMLNSFKNEEPLCYYNEEVYNEVYTLLATLYEDDSEKFYESFYKYQSSFFSAINSYHKIIDLYYEFDDIDFESDIKNKIYIFPIITQILEFCLNHYYRGIASILGDFRGKDYTQQKTLQQLKSALSKELKHLINIDIDFRNAISHGTIQEILEGYRSKFIYEYTTGFDKNNNKILDYKTISLDNLKELKNQYLDISSGAILGLIKFLNNKNILRDKDLISLPENKIFEFIKMLFHSENIRVKTFSKDKVDTLQLNIHITVKDINDTMKIYFIATIISKILYTFFPNYDRYFIHYVHPYSIGGMISYSKEQVISLIENPDIPLESVFALLPEIQEQDIDYRAYRFHTFPKLNSSLWEVKSMEDVSNEKFKRYKATLMIDNISITKKEVENIIFQVTAKIKSLENMRNPLTKIKYGKIDADIVSISLYYKTKKRHIYTYIDNEYFICEAQYYRTNSIPKYTYHPFKTTKEKIKKWDIYWSEIFLSRS